MDLLSFHSEENMQEKVIADLQSFHNDADTVRERLLQLYIQIYPSLFASKAQPDPIFLIDEYLQGEFKELFSIDWSDENIETLVYMTTNCVSIEGFAGMMLYYCPKRYGKHYDAVVNKLLESDNGNGLANEKIEGLLGDYVNASSGATKKFYNLPYIWIPNKELFAKIKKICDPNTLKDIEANHRSNDRKHLNVYRANNTPNRHQKSNWFPNTNRLFDFEEYDNAIHEIRD